MELDQTQLSDGEDPLATTLADVGDAEALGLKTGVILGRYVILGHLGSGAMGSVLEAFDPELERKVAIKVLHQQGDGEEGRLRLLREAQAMARLQHPNVVAIHDVGALGDRVWLAMELVEGQTLKAWLADHPRPWSEILGVMVAAAEGLAAAHAAGLVHRDVKPENVMVSAGERVRVADFGLARAGSELREEAPPGELTSQTSSLLESELTHAGALIGTPRYMAPEGLLGLPVDARSDQFSWCVSAWEALHGAPPYDADNLVDLTRQICGGKRAAPPPGRRIPGWLKKIIERGLEVMPERRFASLADLVAAIHDHQRRRRLRLGAYGMVGVGLLGAGLLGAGELSERRAAARCEAAGAAIDAVWGEGRAAEVAAAFKATGRADAASLFEHARPWLDRYADAWRRARVDACAPRRLDLDLRRPPPAEVIACLEERRESLSALLELFARADGDVVQRSVHAAARLPPIAACEDAAALARAPRLPDDPAERQRIAALRGRLSRITSLELAGKPATAIAEIDGVLADAEALGWPPLLLSARYSKAGLLLVEARFNDAEASLEETLYLAERLGDDDKVGEAASMLTFVVGNLLGRADEGLRWGRLGHAVYERLGELESIRYITLLGSLGIVHEKRGDLAKAQEIKEKALELSLRLYGEEHPGVASAHNNLAVLLMERGDLAAAERHHREAMALRERSLDPDHIDVAYSRINLGLVYYVRGDQRRAIAEQERALATIRAVFGRGHIQEAIPLENLGVALTAAGDLEAARGVLEEALSLRRAALGPDHHLVGLSHAQLGELLAARGELAAAEAELSAGIAIFEATLGPEHQDTGHALARRGRVRIAAGDRAAGLADLERAWAIAGGGEGREVSAHERADIAWTYAQALADAGDAARGRPLAEQARRLYQEMGADLRVPPIDAWLAAHPAAADGDEG
ncbi:MAG: serine/threonine protein kinase [Myxococcales bacterium]|nr:serine/threonine protein kinase [Myxococcales bacterium]